MLWFSNKINITKPWLDMLKKEKQHSNAALTDFVFFHERIFGRENICNFEKIDVINALLILVSKLWNEAKK